MKKRAWFAAAVGLLVLSAAGFYEYQKRAAKSSSPRSELLALMPGDASAILFVDLAELRAAPFVKLLYAWAPTPPPDLDYAQFVKDTGFNYEQDLDRFAIAFTKMGQDSVFFSVADGKFDRQKITAFATKSGTVAKINGREIFSVPESSRTKKISFTFLRENHIALSDSGDLSATFRKREDDATEWRSRFERLSGSSIFAVIRQEAAPGAALSAQAPGGFRSPQLSVLVDQLQWITLAGRPESDRLRVIVEGESSSAETTRQLADLLNGILSLAEAGLNDVKTRRQLDPALRSAYLDLLKSADVSKIDRGETQSVRLVFDVTPAFLEAAGRTSAVSHDNPAKTRPGSPLRAKKGHT